MTDKGTVLYIDCTCSSSSTCCCLSCSAACTARSGRAWGTCPCWRGLPRRRRGWCRSCCSPRSPNGESLAFTSRWKVTKPKSKCTFELDVNERKWQQPLIQLFFLVSVCIFVSVLPCPLGEIWITLPRQDRAAMRATLPIPVSVCSIFMCPNNSVAASVWDF